MTDKVYKLQKYSRQKEAKWSSYVYVFILVDKINLLDDGEGWSSNLVSSITDMCILMFSFVG